MAWLLQEDGGQLLTESRSPGLLQENGDAIFTEDGGQLLTQVLGASVSLLIDGVARHRGGLVRRAPRRRTAIKRITISYGDDEAARDLAAAELAAIVADKPIMLDDVLAAGERWRPEFDLARPLLTTDDELVLLLC